MYFVLVYFVYFPKTGYPGTIRYKNVFSEFYIFRFIILDRYCTVYVHCKTVGNYKTGGIVHLQFT